VSIPGTGGQPYQTGHHLAPGNTFNGYQESIPFWVPEGKLLVVEHICGRINLPTGHKIKKLGLLMYLGGDSTFHWIDPVSLGKGNYRFSQELTVYADGGGNHAVLIAIRSHGSPVGHWYFSLSGYLIDAP
jgi:hypothetical protein